MNGLEKIFCVLSFITIAASAQVKKIQFVSDENQLPVSNVEVYDGNSLMGKSDPNGYFDVKTGNSNYLRTIRDDYQDAFIKVADLQKKMTLIKNKPIELQEVVIGSKVKMSVRKILNRIQDNLDNPEIRKLPDYLNVTNKLLSETDTLHYLKGLMKHERGKSYRLDKNSSLVKKFKYDKTQGIIYTIDKKSMAFHDHLTTPFILNNDGILSSNILKDRSNYIYTVTNIGDFYKVEIMSKNKSPFGFSGYLIVDKMNFSICEFKAHLLDNTENNEKSMLLQNKIEQINHVTRTDYYSKYQKDKDGIYQFLCSYCDKQFEQTQGDFKGKKFSYSSKLEASDNYKNSEFIEFNIYTYEVK